jgi:hypothetical protein
MSFISDLGDKNKESVIKKRSFKVGCCLAFSLSFFWEKRYAPTCFWPSFTQTNYGVFISFKSRWLILKDSWIGYLNPQTGLLKQVLLVDQGFRVLTGQKSTGTRNGLFIENLSK